MPEKPSDEPPPWEDNEIPSFDELDLNGIADFIQRKGAAALLIEIGDGGVPYTELEDRLPVSKSTFYHRIGEAADLYLVGTSTGHGEDMETKYYVLTPAGRAVYEYITDVQLHKVYWKLQERQSQYDELTSDVKTWVEEEDDEFAESFRGWARYMEQGDESWDYPNG